MVTFLGSVRCLRYVTVTYVGVVSGCVRDDVRMVEIASVVLVASRGLRWVRVGEVSGDGEVGRCVPNVRCCPN